MLDINKQKALKELLEVLSKGVDLLANQNLDRDLYNAYEKYAESTIKLVNEAYNQNYISYFSNTCSPFNSLHHMYGLMNPFISTPHSARDVMMNYSIQQQSAEYREKLKVLLQKLISVAKITICE